MVASGSLQRSPRSIGTIWDLEWKLTAVVHGDSYKVVELTKKQNLLVWVSRTPLEKDQQKAFLRHIARLLPFSTLPVVSHGIDGLGFGYVALQIEGCNPIDSNNPTLLEMRYRFIECVAKVAFFHQKNIPLENISSGAFVLDGDQEVVFVGLFGGFAVRDMEAVPLDVRACLPLSSLSNLLTGTKADVYALAVLGLRLFGAQFPPSGINPEEVEQYVERIPDSAPRWVSHVLGPIVKQPQRSALRDATDLLSALAEHERRYPPSELQSGAARKKKGEEGGARAKLIASERLLSVQELASRTRFRDRRKQRSFLKRSIHGRAGQLLAILFLIGVAIKTQLIPVAWFGELYSRSAESPTPTSSHVLNEVESYGRIPSRDALSFSNIIANFERLSSEESQSQLWEIAGKTLTEKGYHNTAIMAAAAVREGGGSVRQPAALARLLSPEISTQERVQHLRSYETIAPELAGRAGAAFALDDTAARELYRDALISSTQKLVSPAVHEQVSARSTLALIVALGGKSELSEVRNLEIMREVSPSDLWWLVSFLAERRSDTLPLVIDSALSRGLCDEVHRVFLELVRQAEIGPTTPYEALIHSAQRGPKLEHVELFSQWLAPQSEQALYATLLTSTEPSVVGAALDSLRTKPQPDGLVVQVIDVARSQGDGEMQQYAFLIGSLGLRGILDKAVVAQGLQSLKEKPLASQIAQKIVEHGDTDTIATTLAMYGQLIHPSFLIPLLKHPDSMIRRSTVPLVKELPLASSRVELQRLYDAEQDSAVREVYEREGVVAR